ncbi:hypothetical protein E2320_006538 [Naja naja]|nr:hypothetical protein E2320_006538 [Naja naja]
MIHWHGPREKEEVYLYLQNSCLGPIIWSGLPSYGEIGRGPQLPPEEPPGVGTADQLHPEQISQTEAQRMVKGNPSLSKGSGGLTRSTGAARWAPRWTYLPTEALVPTLPRCCCCRRCHCCHHPPPGMEAAREEGQRSGEAANGRSLE